uniref:Uncharacterized protein n=1 Tax=Chromera velia CCMP2878 TaxID=1169474 RepID=A0A0G4G527_9ALVE|mmetsp:Transcript_12286/g.23825  ORF Transcript_12286/g.23825 Transcript_12286/m.23825 type:complete len:437 (+) Transcript_12286:234-1544(+)|eukprot:Cvel_20318.t1-p1 / transcript=Cvel_20318.t1 / gene=Cvel_20318 / organism=Chromera_velia_CCMP2878 / gene_product=hypothetical protein / transcript_product=hypothetical protein / location=Cvel_scaffold1814:28220-30101(+) / protein_length=436 / sequence_SO=supercontig / SO=protein_coding / is_pseudo=false
MSDGESWDDYLGYGDLDDLDEEDFDHDDYIPDDFEDHPSDFEETEDFMFRNIVDRKPKLFRMSRERTSFGWDRSASAEISIPGMSSSKSERTEDIEIERTTLCFIAVGEEVESIELNMKISGRPLPWGEEPTAEESAPEVNAGGRLFLSLVSLPPGWREGDTGDTLAVECQAAADRAGIASNSSPFMEEDLFGPAPYETVFQPRTWVCTRTQSETPPVSPEVPVPTSSQNCVSASASSSSTASSSGVERCVKEANDREKKQTDTAVASSGTAEKPTEVGGGGRPDAPRDSIVSRLNTNVEGSWLQLAYRPPGQAAGRYARLIGKEGTFTVRFCRWTTVGPLIRLLLLLFTDRAEDSFSALLRSNEEESVSKDGGGLKGFVSSDSMLDFLCSQERGEWTPSLCKLLRVWKANTCHSANAQRPLRLKCDLTQQIVRFI